MSSKHVIKHTETEIVFKCYIVDASGGSIDLSLENDMTKSTQLYAAPSTIPVETDGHFENTYTGSRVYFTGMWWGLKKDKQLDISRILDPVVPTLHGHYYLTNTGQYDFKDFSDRVYANRNIRLTFDGPGHCIIRLRKEGWIPKVETTEFGQYDDVTQVGR